MKSRFSMHFALLILLLLIIITFRILSPAGVGEDEFLILKIYITCLIFSITFLFLIIIKIYRELFLLITNTLKTCEDLKKLIFDLRDGTKTYYEEKRTAERIKECVTIKIIFENSSEFVKTLDLSKTGARFRTSRKLPLDGLIDVNVYLSLFPQPISVRARVARVDRPAEDPAIFDIGIEFLSVNEHDKEKLTETLRLLDKD
jgi:hypothetical protein